MCTMSMDRPAVSQVDIHGQEDGRARFQDQDTKKNYAHKPVNNVNYYVCGVSAPTEVSACRLREYS